MEIVQEAIGDGSDIGYEAALQGLSMIMGGLTVLMENIDIAAIQEGVSEIYGRHSGACRCQNGGICRAAVKEPAGYDQPFAGGEY